jgi:predicted nucleic acid-binding protein
VIVFDAQPVSQLQRAGSRDVERLERRLHHLPADEVWITVITPIEQLKMALGKINSERDPAKQVPYFAEFLKLFDHYIRLWTGRILPFDQKAASTYGSFSPKLIRKIGWSDAHIAAIALSQGATLVTANKRDLEQVPALNVADWLG